MMKLLSGMHLSYVFSALAVLFMVIANIVYRFKNKNNIVLTSFFLITLKSAAFVAMSLLVVPHRTLPIGNVLISVGFSLVAIIVALITVITYRPKNYVTLVAMFYCAVVLSNFSMLIA